MTKQDSAPPPRRVYGRRQNRPLNASRSQAIGALLPRLSLEAECTDSSPASLDPKTLFCTSMTRFSLEIGFGSGERMATLLLKNPDTGYLGAEPFINGMAAFLKSIYKEKPANIRVLMDDAMLLVHALKDECLDEIYILNPDPWPKKRHHKRRIVSQANLGEFARTLKPGGKLIMTTDVPDLAEWMVTQATLHPSFRWTAQSARDWKIPPADWTPTRYETKGAKGAESMVYLVFERI